MSTRRLAFVKDTLKGIAEANAGETKVYTPGDFIRAIEPAKSFMSSGRGNQKQKDRLDTEFAKLDARFQRGLEVAQAIDLNQPMPYAVTVRIKKKKGQ